MPAFAGEGGLGRPEAAGMLILNRGPYHGMPLCARSVRFQWWCFGSSLTC